MSTTIINAQVLTKEARLANAAQRAAVLPPSEARRVLAEALDEFHGRIVNRHPTMSRVFGHWLKNANSGVEENAPGLNHSAATAATPQKEPPAEKTVNCPKCTNPFVYTEPPDKTNGSDWCPACRKGLEAGAFTPEALKNAATPLLNTNTPPAAESLANRDSGAAKGCLMAFFPALASIPKWAEDNVPAEALVKDGVEEEPHVTVLYGFLPSLDIAKLGAFLKTFGPVKMALGKLEKFECPDKGYDVLKFPVVSDDLMRLNAALQKEFASDIAPSDYPVYMPHLTVAYVKPGTPVPATDTEVIMTSTALEYSPAENKTPEGRTLLPLVDTPATA